MQVSSGSRVRTWHHRSPSKAFGKSSTRGKNCWQNCFSNLLPSHYKLTLPLPNAFFFLCVFLFAHMQIILFPTASSLGSLKFPFPPAPFFPSTRAPHPLLLQAALLPRLSPAADRVSGSLRSFLSQVPITSTGKRCQGETLGRFHFEVRGPNRHKINSPGGQNKHPGTAGEPGSRDTY